MRRTIKPNYIRILQFMHGCERLYFVKFFGEVPYCNWFGNFEELNKHILRFSVTYRYLHMLVLHTQNFYALNRFAVSVQTFEQKIVKIFSFSKL